MAEATARGAIPGEGDPAALMHGVVDGTVVANDSAVVENLSDALSLDLDTVDATLVRRLLAKSVLALHLSITLFCIVAFLGPEPVLWFHLFFVPLMVLHWRLNDSVCILTDLENWLLGKRRDMTEPNRFFVIRLSDVLLRRPLTEVGADRLARGVTWGAWAASLIRLSLIHLR